MTLARCKNRAAHHNLFPTFVWQMVMGMLKMQDPDEISFQSINFNFYTTSAVLQVKHDVAQPNEYRLIARCTLDRWLVLPIYGGRVWNKESHCGVSNESCIRAVPSSSRCLRFLCVERFAFA